MSQIPNELLEQMTPAVQAFVEALLVRLGEQDKRIAELEAKLNKTSRNSSKPPSTEHPHAGPLPKKMKSKNKRGGQPGHQRFERTLIPAEQCQSVIPCKPEVCRGCGETLLGEDSSPLRQQVWDVEIKPVVTEYQQHRLICPCCEMITCGSLPEEADGRTGPVLAGMLVLMTSWFRTSRRRAALFSSEVCGVPCSPGHVSALEAKATQVFGPVYDELAAALPDQSHLNIDETPFKRGSLKTWLWTFVASAFTVFVLRPTRKASVLIWAIGEDYDGAIHCDRAKMYFQYDTLQWCWAHLKRDFQKLADSADGQVKRLGDDLLRETTTLFAAYGKCRDGTMTHAELQEKLSPVRDRVNDLLLRGYGTAMHGMCKSLFAHKNHLWTFLENADVAPTNNAAERSLRHGVIWRKLTSGTRSERGDRFVEVMLSVIETCRQQERSVLTYVTTSLKTKTPTSLLPSNLPNP
jgi:transposase